MVKMPFFFFLAKDSGTQPSYIKHTAGTFEGILSSAWLKTGNGAEASAVDMGAKNVEGISGKTTSSEEAWIRP